MIKIKNLQSGYEKLQVLFGVNIAVKPNEIVVIIGPNGAGKSTVLKSIFSLTNIYNGTIIFKNKDITRISTYKLIQLGISYVPQGRQIFGSLTVYENLQMGGFLIKDKELINKKINEVLMHFPELKNKLDEYAFNLSGGQQQMLAIARALIQDPQLLLLDEPSLGLSPLLTKQLFKKIQDINKEGCAILMVEQNAKQACQIADNIYVLENGKVAFHGTKKILKSERIKHIYLGGA